MDRDIAMVFQNYALYPHMSVYDNMAFGLKMRKFDRADIAQRVQEAAEILGMQDLLKRKPRQLSGGQRQRVALGRAIVRHPQVFLFDEPLSNLDAKLRVQMRVELKKLHDRLGTTAIYVTHDQVEAMTLGDRVVVMRDGLVQQVGEPLELYNEPANRFVAGFLGSPSMNFATVVVAVKLTGHCGPRMTASASRCRARPPGASAAMPGSRSRSGSGPKTCMSPPKPTRPNWVSTPWSRSSRSSARKSCSTWRWARTSMVASVEPSVRVDVRDRLAAGAEPGAAALLRCRVRGGDLNRGKFAEQREGNGKCDARSDYWGSSGFIGAVAAVNALAQPASTAGTAFDGTYRFVSSANVNATYTTRNGRTGPCPNRRTGPLHIANGQVRYTTATGYKLRGTVGPQGELALGLVAPSNSQQRGLPATQHERQRQYRRHRHGARTPNAVILAVTISSGKNKPSKTTAYLSS